MKRNLLLALGAVGLSATAVATLNLGPDFTSLPPKPTVIAEQLAAAKTPLATAVRTAEERGKGLAGEVRRTDGAYEVDVFGRTGSQTVSVSMATGEVVSTSPIQWLPGDLPTTEWITTDSGLQYAEIVVGTGEMPDGPTDTVKAHYTGYFVNGDVFDSSVERGQPLDFPLNQVIAGWTEGLQSMKVGGKRKLVIPFDLAYGAYGRPPAIPAKATLIFDVELIALP